MKTLIQKTPIQQFIEVLTNRLATSKGAYTDPAHRAIKLNLEIQIQELEACIEAAESMLDKEKSAIQQAFYEGMLCQGFDPNMGRAEIYYNETFDTNEQ